MTTYFQLKLENKTPRISGLRAGRECQDNRVDGFVMAVHLPWSMVLHEPCQSAATPAAPLTEGLHGDEAIEAAQDIRWR
jgi:hypothetical protein